MSSGIAENTVVLMSDCVTKKIQKIKIGDKIMGSNSKPLIVEDILMKNNDMYEIVPIKGPSFNVSGDNYLVLKASNYEGISWEKGRKRYQVKWVENFTIKMASFPISRYENMKSSSKRQRKKTEEELKKLTYTAAKHFLEKQVSKRDGYTKYGDIVKITVCEYLKLPKHIKSIYKVFSIKTNFKEKEIDLDPYILGYWLGDGTSKASEITTAEKEVVDYFQEYADDNDLLFIHGSSKYKYRISGGLGYGAIRGNSLINFLKENDLWGNKHIPNDYIMNSRENRLKLLAGLVDSDGSNSYNAYDFIFKSEKLADDVILLARSLGFKAFKSKCRKTCTNGPNGPVTGTYYRFIIYGAGIHEVPSLLKRKQTREREHKKNALVSGFKINHVGKMKSYKLEFEGKHKRFLLHDFTVVHN